MFAEIFAAAVELDDGEDPAPDGAEDAAAAALAAGADGVKAEAEGVEADPPEHATTRTSVPSAARAALIGGRLGVGGIQCSFARRVEEDATRPTPPERDVDAHF
jgi:hypothetical protein